MLYMHCERIECTFCGSGTLGTGLSSTGLSNNECVIIKGEALNSRHKSLCKGRNDGELLEG